MDINPVTVSERIKQHILDIKSLNVELIKDNKKRLEEAIQDRSDYIENVRNISLIEDFNYMVFKKINKKRKWYQKKVKMQAFVRIGKEDTFEYSDDYDAESFEYSHYFVQYVEKQYGLKYVSTRMRFNYVDNFLDRLSKLEGLQKFLEDHNFPPGQEISASFIEKTFNLRLQEIYCNPLTFKIYVGVDLVDVPSRILLYQGIENLIESD